MKYLHITSTELLLSFLQNTYPFKADYYGLEYQISFQFELLFFQIKAFQVGNRYLKSIIFRIVANIFSILLEFSIKNYTLTAITDTVRIGYNSETVGLNSIKKKEILFKLEKGSLWE